MKILRVVSNHQNIELMLKDKLNTAQQRLAKRRGRQRRKQVKQEHHTHRRESGRKQATRPRSRPREPRPPPCQQLPEPQGQRSPPTQPPPSLRSCSRTVQRKPLHCLTRPAPSWQRPTLPAAKLPSPTPGPVCPRPAERRRHHVNAPAGRNPPRRAPHELPLALCKPASPKEHGRPQPARSTHRARRRQATVRRQASPRGAAAAPLGALTSVSASRRAPA